MLYTPSHAELGQHPKTRRLARLLGVSIPTAVGHLHLLWHFALKYAPDGDLSGFDALDVADGALWEGDPAALLAALTDAGWLDAGQLHDWGEYGGKFVERKEANAERMRDARATGKYPMKPPRAAHVQRTSEARAEHVSKRAALEETRGEETRGEKKRGERGVSRGKRATALPEEFPITDEMRQWAATHTPGVDLALHHERFCNYWWSERKTKPDWQLTWRNWMLREQDGANRGGPSRASPNGGGPLPRRTANNIRALEVIRDER